jgi:hypothetical protein
MAGHDEQGDHTVYSNSKYNPKLDLPGSYAPILGENQGRFGEFSG